LVASGTTGTFSSSITGLTANTLYYVRAYATNSAGTAYGNEVSFTTTSSSGQTGTVTDTEGNIYNTITIGTQVWMAENLKTTKYNDNTAIPLVTDNTEWQALSTPAYCWYNNDEATNKPVYGALYNWYTVNTGKICPAGWHVPSDTEWKTLEIYLGMTQSQADATGWRGTNQGTQIKNITGWSGGSINTNTSGFSALPGGARDFASEGASVGQGSGVAWWTATEYNTTIAWYRYVGLSQTTISRSDSNNKKYGFAVRCLRDN
jgi:uncharacterized protein (TIGR02145 family)